MKVILMSGCSGSGKSTVAQKLAQRGWNPHIVSADDYFMVDGVYRFDAGKLGPAHHQCQDRFRLALLDPDSDTVIVDNTNTTAEEIRRYLVLAEESGFSYRVCVVTVPCDVTVAHGRQTHGVPLRVVEAQASRIARRKLPVYLDEFIYSDATHDEIADEIFG